MVTLENRTGKGVGALAFDQRRPLPCLEDNPAFSAVTYDFERLQRGENQLGLARRVKGRVAMEKMLSRRESALYRFSEEAKQDLRERETIKKFELKNFLPNSVKTYQL